MSFASPSASCEALSTALTHYCRGTLVMNLDHTPWPCGLSVNQGDILTVKDCSYGLVVSDGNTLLLVDYLL